METPPGTSTFQEIIHAGGPVIVGLAGIVILFLVLWKYAGRELVNGFISVSQNCREASMHCERTAEIQRQTTEALLAADKLNESLGHTLRKLIDSMITLKQSQQGKGDNE